MQSSARQFGSMLGVGLTVVLMILSSSPASNTANPLATWKTAMTPAVNGTNATWTDITGNVTGTNSCTGFIAFDTHDNYTICLNAASYGTDTLVFHGGQWINLTGAGEPPEPLRGIGMIYDPAISGVVLFNESNYSHVWSFQSGNWTELSTTNSTELNVEVNATNPTFIGTYDFADGYILLASPNVTSWSLNSTLVWAAQADLPPFPQGPLWNRQNTYAEPVMTYDGYDGYILAISDLGESYSYSAGAWTNQTANSTHGWTYLASLSNTCYNCVGNSTSGESLVYDPQIAAVVLFAGSCSPNGLGGGGCGPSNSGVVFNCTWMYQSGNWTNITSSTGPVPAESSVAYDAANGFLLAVGNGEWALSNGPVDISPVDNVTLAAAPNPISVGDPINISVSFVGGRAPFQYVWANATANWTTSTNWTAQVFELPRTYLIAVTVKGSDGTFQSSSLNVTADPFPLTLHASPNPVQIGEPVNVSVSFSDQQQPFTYRWSLALSNHTENSTTSTNWTDIMIESPGTYPLTVEVANSFGIREMGSISISANPLVLDITAAPNSTDVGVPVTLSVSFTSGQAPFFYLWSNGATTNQTTESWSTPGEYTVSVTVTNSLGINQTGTVRVLVNPSPIASITFTRDQTVGIAENFTASSSNGTGEFQYLWSFGDGTSALTALGSHTYTQSGSYTVHLTATDSLGQLAVSIEMVTVAPLIVAFLSVSNATPSIEQSILFTTNTSGGLGVFTFSWANLPFGCNSVDSATIGCAPTQSGVYFVTVNVTDMYPGQTSAAINVTVSFAFTVSVSTTTPQVGQNVTVGVSSETPASDLTYSYSGLPPGCVSADTPELICTPDASGNFTITVTVTDVAAGVSISHTFELDVVGAASHGGTGNTTGNGTKHTGNVTSTPPTSSSTSFLDLAVGLIVGLVVGAAAVALVWRLHRTAPPPRP